MLYYIFFPLRDIWFGFNVFKYITFRAAMAAIFAFLFTLIFGKPIIAKLKSMKVGERIRSGEYYEDLHKRHGSKEGTPTMGGLIILIAIMLSTLLWSRVGTLQVQVIVISTLWLGLIGFIDDWIKLKQIGRRGLPGRVKLAGQIILGLAIGLYLFYNPETGSYAGHLRLPFFKDAVWEIGIFSVLFTILVLVGTTNAVNLTDGLDGLAIGCLGIAALAFAVLAYVSGHLQFAGYLQILYIPGSGELAVFCSALAGAALGFLWFNAYPAEIFMGDTGALACGGAIGTAAILIKKELFLVLIGGVFIVEALSVIIQVLSFKMTGRRVFKMAPIHHHFEMKKIPESKITVRFWICAIICALIGLGALKLQ
ncbi:MAG TPA: phospho-N-acetylmuramoyl-pentapeptide-transferase [Proteobacteria bacterium]|nr:phospho-N-acetylmuramoyl-pentapeptide-transferase [Pseudomonadota bacterium]